MGCGETLFVGEGGRITCSWKECPDPAAVDKILADEETNHIIELREDGYTIQHPLKERIDDGLFACNLQSAFSKAVVLHGEVPLDLGRYRVVRYEGEPEGKGVTIPGLDGALFVRIDD